MNFTSEEPSGNKISFLDVQLTTTHDGITHELYQKPTHSGKYLPYSSHCEERIKWNIAKSETRRILSLCSHKGLAWPHLENLRLNLIASGYPSEKVTTTILKQIESPPNSPADTTTNWDNSYILRVPYCNEATTRMLRNKLKKSHLPIKLVTTSGSSIADVVKRQLKQRVAASEPCDCILHEHGIPCNNSHVVYQATCQHCQKRYIGQTGRPLLQRLGEHENSTRMGNDKTPLGEHLSEEHPENVLGEPARGRRNWESFLQNYKVEVIGRSRDTLGTYILENQEIKTNAPELNTQLGNGYVY